MRRSASCKDINGYGELLCRLETLEQCQTVEETEPVQITYQARRGRATTSTLVVEDDAHPNGGGDGGDGDAHLHQYPGPEERRQLLIQHGLSVQSLP
jgi:hypothetical protein